MVDLSRLGMPAWSAVVVLAVVATAAGLDRKTGKIPNWLTYGAIVAGLVVHSLLGGLHGQGPNMGLAGAILGLLAGFVPLALVWRAGGIGGGDAKLMGAIGALGGWEFVLSAMLYGFLATAAMAVVVMIRKRIVRRTLRRVLHAAALVVLPGAKAADATTADSPRVPVAVGFCIGVLAAIIEGAWRAGAFRHGGM
jgi:Flp pilus assembly protein protease CpaA